MAISKVVFSAYIKEFQFIELFNEMGWNNDHTNQYLILDEIPYNLNAIAEKSGFKIFICKPLSSNKIPDSATRKKIEGKVTKLFQEHLIIFIDEHKQEQVWQLAVRKVGNPTKISETRFTLSQDPELLYQRASGLFFTLDEEEKVTIVDVTRRVADNFQQNNERVTKRFYESFKKEHKAFLNFIKGIEDQLNMDWYASLMLNRLMFCYFIQKKGFLDDNKNYLQDKLEICKAKKGKNKFYSFYRDFLLALFHKGLGSPSHSKNLDVEIGRIPYLNGGLFDEHEIEKTFNDIAIDDKAFEKLFDFFDQYEWHLDTRESASGREINPDVIGYIFEKYINDRAQMGAYYTKEDITDYISKNCIIPWLFDEVKRQYPKAFADDSWLWHMLKASGDHYIYDAVKYGIPETGGLFDDLPIAIQKGFAPELEKKVVDGNGPWLWELRKEWNKPAPSDIALPTEIYRETIERRKRYAEIKGRVTGGGIKEINDFITYNLNIRQFAQDVIETTDDTEFIRYFYKALSKITILDPTCGSGAFLFAAMNILEPLYEGCIQRMKNFIYEAGKGKHKFFEDTLKLVNAPEHPNLHYFIYKSIILNNLYGVDIMKEAVEIAKLRLFLKLVATVDADYRKSNLGLEPLPDVDFNIRAGNTLVGYATEEQLKDAFVNKFDFDNDVNKIKEKCDIVGRAFARYKEIQLEENTDFKDFKTAKDDLNERLYKLRSELDGILHKQHYINNINIKYDTWLATHQPFHWFAEFYEIVHDRGGFDVVIGNPPYVELKVSEKAYKIIDPEINTGGNLHSIVAARAHTVLEKEGFLGFIVPIAISNTDRMKIIRKRFISSGLLWVSNYAIRPGKLFSGAEQRLSIYIFQKSHKNSGKIWTSKYYKWNKEERNFLFDCLSLNEFIIDSEIWYKMPSKLSSDIFIKIKVASETVGKYIRNSNKPVFYKNTGIGYYIVATLHAPICYINGIKTSSSRETTICFETDDMKRIFQTFLISNTFFLLYHARSNCRDLNPSDITLTRFPYSLLKENDLIRLANTLQEDLDTNSWYQIRNQKQTGEVNIQSYTVCLSKPIIDQIDCLLAQHYGFTHEELDFIINYDIKYRMGKELEGVDE